VARSRARASSVRPSSTMASSMTGSSRNDGSRPTPGTCEREKLLAETDPQQMLLAEELELLLP